MEIEMQYMKKSQDGAITFPFELAQLRKDHPNTSFPALITDATLAAYGVYSVTLLDAPAYNAGTQRIEQDAQPTESNGQWELRWSVIDLTAEELAAKAAAAEAEVRMHRDRILAGCDWTQAADAPVDQAAWATYRQALRDVPSQAGFPHNVTWPTKPE